MKNHKHKEKNLIWIFYGLTGLLLAAGLYVLWKYVPYMWIRWALAVVLCGLVSVSAGAIWYMKRRIGRFTDEICESLDAQISGREVRCRNNFEDSLSFKVQSKLEQYYGIMKDERRECRRDKQIVQEMVSDISHQVKTPMANIRLFSNILNQKDLPDEKRRQFREVQEFQLHKLEFLLDSLVKMSRLETGTFALHMAEGRLYDTLVQAVNTVWAKAEKKNLRLDLECSREIVVKHDAKWTAEAIGNILDNAVKYTPEGGSVRVSVHPWQFYTRVDITDTGIGIEETQYHQVFRRFYRAEEVSQEEGVGLGLYLAQGIIRMQKGYITVKSKVGEGTTFSVHLMS